MQLKPKTSNPDKILDSIIQSRCLAKDQDQSDKQNSQNTYKDNDVLSNDSKLRKSISNLDKKEDKLVIEKRQPKEDKKESRDRAVEEDIDKPWISYLRNLRIPMMCQLHRKITLAISENSLKATPSQEKKKDKPSASLKNRNFNNQVNHQLLKILG